MNIIDKNQGTYNGRGLNILGDPTIRTFGLGDYDREVDMARRLNRMAEEAKQHEEDVEPVKEDSFDYGFSFGRTAEPIQMSLENQVKNKESLIGDGSDTWRQMNIQGHTVNLDKKLQNLFDSEGKWYPEIQEAQEYVQLALELNDLNNQNTSNYNASQLEAHNTRKSQILDKINDIEPRLREYSRYNPYIRDVFYETNFGKANKNNVFSNWEGYTTFFRDWSNDLILDLNPSNNLSHAIATIDGGGGSLSKETLNKLFSMKTNINDNNKLFKQQDELNKAVVTAKTQLDVKTQDIQAKINTIKKGNWLFDPTKLSEEYKQEFQRYNQEGLSLSDPKSWYYALPHLGSSYSEFGAMLGQMGASMMMNHVAKGALAATTGGTLPLLYAMTEAGVNLAIAKYMRESETASETFSAMNERVARLANERKVNLREIIRTQITQLENLGYDVNNMSADEITKAATAHHILSGNDAYDEVQKEAEKGLEVVRLTNNALSIPDLLEANMFSYGGRYLSKAYGLMRMGGKEVLPQTVAYLDAPAQGIIDRTITKVANKMATNPMGKVATDRALHTTWEMGKKLGLTYFTERTEEGQQHLVSSRYKEGKYNNVEDYSFADGAAHAFQLGVEANLAYYGIHPDKKLNTDKELENVMNIGGFTGLFMTGVYSAPSLYQDIQQISTDQNLRGLVADNYGTAERDAKIEQIMNAVTNSKDGNFGRIRESLESLKNYKPEGVTNEMIDEDIDLTARIASHSSNKALTEVSDKIGAPFGSKTKTQIIRNTIHLEDRLRNQQEASERNTEELRKIEQEIFNDKSNDTILQTWYEQYKESQETPVSFEEYKKRIIDNTLSLMYYEHLQNLQKQLKKRKNDLTKLKEDLGLDVNVDGITGIQEYVDAQLKKSKDFVNKLVQNARDNSMEGTDEQILKQIKKEQLSLPKQEELQTLWAAKSMNSGAVDNLRKHMTAYTLGLYFGDISGYKPIWSNLTEAQQQKILDDAAREDEAAGRAPRTRKQIISTYNLEVAREWNDRNLDEDVADKTGLAHRKAQAIIQMDLKNLNDEEIVAREERIEEHGTPIETKPEETTVEENVTPETTATEKVEEESETVEETKEEEQPPLDEIETEDDLLLKQLDQSNDESLEVGDEIETIDQEEASQYEDTRAENQKVKDELDSYEEVHPLDRPEASEDSYSEGSEQTEDGVEENTEDTQDEVQEEEQPTIPENIETPTASDSVVPGTNEVTEEQEIPGMDIGQPVQVFEGIDGQIHYDPTGEQNVDNSIVIADGNIQLEEEFGSVYDGNIGPSAMQNITADTDSRNSIVTHNKQKRMYVKNTFFFQPTATEAMPITVANKPVVFKTKDGKIAKRGTGSELAEKLATPGWLKTIDDAYCIVTSSTHALKGQSAIDNLAIHIIIEKDGIVYNTSLRAISDKLISDLMNQGLSQEQVNEQISGLRSLREKIIRQYAPNYNIDGKLPIEAAKHVKPTNLRISNGTLNNQTDSAGNPVFRGLHEVADFGISSDPQVLSEQIKSGEVELGYGLGAFTLGEPFSIMRLDQSGDASAQGRGYAGKIFYIPAKQNTPSGTTTLPIMLSEELHRIGLTSAYDIATQKNVDGSINRDADGKPVSMTTAELIYELVINGMFSPELDEALLGILANTGPQTVAMNLEGIEKRKFNFMIRKQFHVFERGGKKFLIYGTDTETADGSYTTKIVDIASISNSERKRILYQIQKNLHWNTDKDALMAPINDAIVRAIVAYAKNNPDIVTSDDYQIRLGNDAITFSLKDVGYTLENGTPVKKGETPILASWFITHKKLKTDLGEHAFSAPFVYAGDPKVEESARPVTKTKDVTSKGEELKHPITQKPAEPKPSTKKATVAEPATEENLKKYGLEIPKDRKLITGRVWAIIDDKQNPGKKKVTQAPKQNVGGVFSTERGTGTMNPKEAKNWLIETLGLSESDIVLIKATLSTYSGEEAFGVVRAAMNAITGGLETKITLSEQSGEGIEYHEGFHYVSLLLLNPQQRQLVYQEYANAIGSETVKDEEVEELLAEDFRKWMLVKKHPFKHLSKAVKEFFINLKDLINIWTSKHLGFGNPSAKRALFKAIRDGKFKESKPAEQVVQDFYLKHPEGFFYYIPGLTQEQLKKMPSILDSDTYYNIVEALTSTALATFNIRTREDVRNLKLNEVFDNIQDFLDNGWIAEENVLLAEDVVNNKDIFVESIKQLLGDLGIKKNDLKETEEQYQNQRDTGETADNVWDKNQGDVSKKDNIAFRAKLFFYSVPKYQYNYTKDEETGAIIKTLDPVLDDMFGMPMSWEFNVAWNKIMESLWDIDTYQDIVDRCAEFGNTDEFFAALYDMLTSKEYPLDDNTKTQLEVTIKSAKVQMNTLKVVHGVPKIDKEMSDDQIEAEKKRALAESIWKVEDSDKLRKIKRLPKRWSQAFFASNALTRDSKGNHIINGNFGAYFVQRRAKITNLITRLTKKKNTIILDTDAQELKDTFIQLLNAMSIPFDSKAYEYLFQNDVRNFINFWKNSKGGGISLNKGIFQDIAEMYQNKRGYIKQNTGEKARSLDKIFTHYNPEAQINQLAYAYGKTHPSPQEFSVTGADGALVYPISENNYMCDQIRNINKNAHGKREQILKTPYSKRSLIANAEGVEFKLHNFLALEIDDSSRDYFGITAVEDYIAKLTLTFNNQMILPTMSDKKTWYSISGLNLVKNIIQSKTVNTAYADELAVTGETPDETKLNIRQSRRFSDETLKIFVNYWLDEFDAVFDYYVRKPWVEKHPTEAVKNYHGKISNGKMDGSGNGGRFRYFSSLNINGEERHVNEELAINEASISNDDMLKYLKDLKVFLLGGETVNNIQDISPNALIWDVINNQLVGATKRELKALIKQGIVGRKNGLYINKLIPNNIWYTYKKLLNEKIYNATEQSLLHEDILFSIIGSHVANQALSIIEVEKCFTGDPAYYKWSKFNMTTPDGIEYQIIRERAIDKIKRLSAVLSTGTNLRTIWETAEESDTRISVLQLSDNEMGSDVYDKLHSIFRNSVLRDLYSRKYPNLTDDEIIQSLNTVEKENAFYKTLSAEEKDFVDRNAKASANPYNFKYKKNKKTGELEKSGGEINQSDAAVYIRPALYRKIMKALGNWSDAIEEAYNIMEGEDESWMNDPVLYAKTTAALINPLKMVYFGDHRNAKLNLNIPVFDKMAMFPMFKCLCKADNRHLYDRMNNEELGVIDMLTFESAVKVGGRKKYSAYNDPENKSFNMEALNKPSYNKTNKEGDLPVFYQDISNLRLQLNTDPHEHKDRSFGTQAVKICLGNVLDDRSYGENKGLSKSGKDIKTEVMQSINALTRKGAWEVIDKFFKNNVISNKKLSDYLVKQAMTSGVSREVIHALTLDENGEFRVPLAAISNRNWIESRILSFINKEVVDLNTYGGAAIQMSSFGFKNTTVAKSSDYSILNNGEKLNFLNEDGSMDVMLSTNFFRHIVPVEYQKSYGMMRNWLLEHKIIGPDSKPFGIGYRIPTQGLSSTFSFKVMDVLPDRIGDTIVVPDEFTAMTGSDFDVDKLYIASLSYDKDDNIIQLARDEKGDLLPMEKQSKEALQNSIILNYQLVVSDAKNMAETRASIDTLTGILKNEILPEVDPKVQEQVLPMTELLPSFQSERKEEYTGGKTGIGPFALNSTNHCLTQLVHLNMIYSGNNRYNLGQIDEINGRDGYRILDWLSSMINAHVDVAKDPYIMTLNVNQITYNMTNLLLRGGMGKTTFYFLAQPILKELAKQLLNNRGVYGVVSQSESDIIKKLSETYLNGLKRFIEDKSWEEKYNGIAEEFGFKGESDNKVKIDYSTTFDQSSLKSTLRASDTPEFYYNQLKALLAYKQLTPDAKRLAELVHRSQIDTKKYGNNLALMTNFKNSYDTFISDNSDYFSIRGVDESVYENDPQYALRTYFGDTFLSTKLHFALSLPRKILRNQAFTANKAFQNIFISSMATFGGLSTVEDRKGRESIGYKHQGDKKLVNKFFSYVDSIVHARIARTLPAFQMTDEEFQGMFYGEDNMSSWLTAIKNYILENKDSLPTLIAQDGTFKNELLNYLQESPANNETQFVNRIVLSESSMNNPSNVEDRLISAFAELLDHQDDIIREFAEKLVKYAYYTSYDQRGVNSFFHLVPMDYKRKIGYVDAIKDALKLFKEDDASVAYDAISEAGDNAAQLYFPSVYVSIARNMWQDESIVPTIELETDYEKAKDNKKTPDVKLKNSVGNNKLYLEVFATGNTDRDFVKITSGTGKTKHTELYMRVGDVVFVNEEGEIVKSGRKGVFKRIPKLGIQDGDFKVMELFKTSNDKSAFEQNAFEQHQVISDEEIAQLASSKALYLKKGSNWTIKYISKESLSIDIKLKDIAAQNEASSIGKAVIETFNDSSIDPNETIGDNIITDPEAYFGQEELKAGESFITDMSLQEEIANEDYLEQLQQEIDDIGQIIENYGDIGQITEDYGDTGQLTENISTEDDLNNKREQGNKIKNNCINK